MELLTLGALVLATSLVVQIIRFIDMSNATGRFGPIDNSEEFVGKSRVLETRGRDGRGFFRRRLFGDRLIEAMKHQVHELVTEMHDFVPS